jgi:leader peptidase (prepilin peptidase)/N-methyltransferase
MTGLEESTGWFGLVSGALVGLVLGSFAGMASWRWPRDESWMGASHCPVCKHRLGFSELVPVVSWLWQRGRARCCGAALSWHYPAVELVTAALAAAAGWRYGLSPEFVLLTALVCTLVIASAIDLACGLIPDGANLAVGLLGAGWLALHPPSVWWMPVLAVAQAGGVGVLLAFGYSKLRGRDMLGWGDVKLMAASGLWIRADLVPPYLLLGGFLGLVFGVLWKQTGRGEEFPFGPSLAVGLLALICWQALAG